MSLKTDTGQPLTVHTADDGLGLRDVYLDGRLLDRVVFADTAAGVVKVVRTWAAAPLRNAAALPMTLCADRWRWCSNEGRAAQHPH